MNIKNIFGFIVVFLLSLSITFSDSNGIWTHVEDIRPGVFGGDEVGGDYVFDNVVYFNEDLIYKSTLIEDLFINRSGDDISGTLNMQNNSIVNISILRGNRVELTGASYIDRIVSQKYFSNGSTVYYLDPAGTSRINNLEVVNNLTYRGMELDSRYINERQSNSVNSAMIVDSTVQNSDIRSNTITGDRISDGTITLNDLNTGNIDNTFATRRYVDNNVRGALSLGDIFPSSTTCSTSPFLLAPKSIGFNSGGRLVVIYSATSTSRITSGSCRTRQTIYSKTWDGSSFSSCSRSSTCLSYK